MSMTHAELQKKYIEKKKQEMGEEAYNKMMREKKAIYRTRVKEQDTSGKLKVENSVDSLNKLRTAFADMTSSKKTGESLRPTTVENYVQKMNRLCILITGKGFSGCLKFLNEPDILVEQLIKSNLKSKKDYLSPVVKLLREQGDDKLVQEYLKHMTSFKEQEDTLRKQNVSTQKERDNYISLNEVQKRIRAFKPSDDIELMYLVIVSMYFMGDDDSLVPRNNLPDFKLVSSSKKIRDINSDYNYLVMRGNEPIGVVMNRYKSQATYGRQKFTLSDFQTSVLSSYIDQFDKKNGDFLFSKGGYGYSYQQFTDLIADATKLILGKPINIDLIRKIIITAYWEDGLHSIAEDEKFARRFLHSVKQSREYAKVDLE